MVSNIIRSVYSNIILLSSKMKHANDNSKTKHATQNKKHQTAVVLRAQWLEDNPEKEKSDWNLRCI